MTRLIAFTFLAKAAELGVSSAAAAAPAVAAASTPVAAPRAPAVAAAPVPAMAAAVAAAPTGGSVSVGQKVQGSYSEELKTGWPRFGSVTVTVTVWGWNGSSGSGFRFRRFLEGGGFCVFQYSLTGKEGSGSGFSSWKMVPAVPVPRLVPGKTVPTAPVSGSGSWATLLTRIGNPLTIYRGLSGPPGPKPRKSLKKKSPRPSGAGPPESQGKFLRVRRGCQASQRKG